LQFGISYHVLTPAEEAISSPMQGQQQSWSAEQMKFKTFRKAQPIPHSVAVPNQKRKNSDGPGSP